MTVLRVKRGINSIVTIADGTNVHVLEDRAFDSDDPVLADIYKATGTKQGDWFQVDDEVGSAGKRRRSVEQATAAPGEYR